MNSHKLESGHLSHDNRDSSLGQSVLISAPVPAVSWRGDITDWQAHQALWFTFFKEWGSGIYILN